MGKPVMETVTEHWGLTLAGLLGAALLLNAAVWKIRTRPLYKKPLTLHNGQGRLRISLGALEDLVWQSATKAAPLRVKAASVRASGRKWLVSLEGEITGPDLTALAARAASVARENGLADDAYALSVGVDMRYAGQAFELTIWTDASPRDPAALRALFEAEHRSRYGYARAALGVEVVSYRIRIVARSGIEVETPLPAGTGKAARAIEIAIDGRRVCGVSLARDTLAPGAKLTGPAVVGEPTSTTFVPPGWEVECLPSGDLMMVDAE